MTTWVYAPREPTVAEVIACELDGGHQFPMTFGSGFDQMLRRRCVKCGFDGIKQSVDDALFS